jgi:Protein of unknown function (DUF2934)
MTADQDGEIARRAYSLWEVEGRPIGRELDHWLRAEAEVQGARAESPDPTPESPATPRRASRKRSRRG